MHVLATLIQNPADPMSASRYQDPAQLRSLGYTGLAVYGTTAVSGIGSPEVLQDGEMRRWAESSLEHLTQTIDAARDAGLDVFIFYDTLVLGRSLVDRDAAQLTCRGRPDTLCPASDLALEASTRGLRALLERWPNVTGVVLRFGDTDAARYPYLLGNDIYQPHCPRCSQMGRADRIVRILKRFRELVVEGSGKTLIARAWNVRPAGLHDEPELARRVCSKLPAAPDDEAQADPRFILSFKFTQTDFWRYQRWNPSSLVCGRLPIMYELQCQREFEGKGGLPNWQAPLWRDGPPECDAEDAVRGLADAKRRVHLAGVLTWVRGGGWGGPFVADETWIDANVFAAPKLAADPELDLEQLAGDWARQRLAVSDKQVVRRLVELLLASPEAVRKGFYIGPYAMSKSGPWHPNADWIQDDLIDAAAAWRMIQRLPGSLLDRAVQEKQQAAEQVVADHRDLSQLASGRRQRQLEPMLNTLVYSESLMETLRDLIAGLVAYRRWRRKPSPDAAATVRQKLLMAQGHWNHHAQRHGSLKGTATSFRETHFWELTQKMLQDVS